MILSDRRFVDSWVKIFKLSVFASVAFGVNLPALSKDESSEILKRGARAMNNLHFEEVMPGNLERECIEETCDSQGQDSAHWKSRKSASARQLSFQIHRKELYEVFDDYQDPGIKQYNDCLEVVQESKFVSMLILLK